MAEQTIGWRAAAWAGLVARCRFAGRCFMTGAEHWGAMSQHNRVVGFLFIGSLVGISSLPIVFSVLGVIPTVVLVALILLAVVVDGAYAEWVKRAPVAEPRIPDNRNDLLRAIHNFHGVTQDYAGILMQAPGLRTEYADNPAGQKAVRDIEGKHRDAFAAADHELALQEKLAGRDFYEVLWPYRVFANLGIMIMKSHDPGDPEYKPFDRDKFREDTRQIEEKIDNGTLYWPMPGQSTPDTALPQQTPTE